MKNVAKNILIILLLMVVFFKLSTYFYKLYDNRNRISAYQEQLATDLSIIIDLSNDVLKYDSVDALKRLCIDFCQIDKVYFLVSPTLQENSRKVGQWENLAFLIGSFVNWDFSEDSLHLSEEERAFLALINEENNYLYKKLQIKLSNEQLSKVLTEHHKQLKLLIDEFADIVD